MKLKTVFAASLLAFGFAFIGSAEEVNTQVIGVLPLTVSGAEVVICVPWVEAGGDGTGVAADNLIKTAGLIAGDELYWYKTSSGKYAGWTVVSNTTTHVQTWDAMSGDTYVPSNEAAIKRGDAVLLKRKKNFGETTIYVVGQYVSGAAVTTVLAGSPGSPTYTLIAPPYADGDVVDLNSDVSWVTPSNEDVLITGISPSTGRLITLSWNGTKWGTYAGITFNDTATVNLGSGFWYKRAGNTDLTVTWKVRD